MVLIKKQNCSQGTGSRVETIGFDSIGQHVKKGRLSKTKSSGIWDAVLIVSYVRTGRVAD